MVQDFFNISHGKGSVIAAAIHNGHELRPEIARITRLSGPERAREEDPHTSNWTEVGDTRIICNRSRFEVDLNRPRDKAVYLKPEDAWGLQLYKKKLPPEVISKSLAEYDRFYQETSALLDEAESRYDHFVMLDIHSYNHRRDGYVIAQEYLPDAMEGDTRMFLMNGLPLRYKGKYADFRRLRTGDDIRSNIHAGGKLRQATITDTHLRIAEIVRPKLVQDGMFLVGHDIVGDKLMEINVFSPGGPGIAQKFEKVNFTHAVLGALERKVEYMKFYRRNIDNVDMCTL